MATHPDVLQLVAILDQEGFGAVGGELLIEVNIGREVEMDAAELDGSDGEVEYEIVREPIPTEEQFGAAMELLRQRLVEPVRAFAEAERIIAEFLKQEPSAIRFIDPRTRATVQPDLGVTPGDARLADKLDELLGRLPAMRTPPDLASH